MLRTTLWLLSAATFGSLGCNCDDEPAPAGPSIVGSWTYVDIGDLGFGNSDIAVTMDLDGSTIQWAVIATDRPGGTCNYLLDLAGSYTSTGTTITPNYNTGSESQGGVCTNKPAITDFTPFNVPMNYAFTDNNHIEVTSTSLPSTYTFERTF